MWKRSVELEEQTQLAKAAAVRLGVVCLQEQPGCDVGPNFEFANRVQSR